MLLAPSASRISIQVWRVGRRQSNAPNENRKTSHELTFSDRRVESEEVSEESSDRKEFVGGVTAGEKRAPDQPMLSHYIEDVPHDSIKDRKAVSKQKLADVNEALSVAIRGDRE